MSADSLEQLQAALRTTISQPYGTGFHVFRGSVLRVAGKSGTSEDVILDPEALDEDEAIQQADDEIEVSLNSDESEEPQAGAEGDAEAQTNRSTNHVWFTGWANFDDPRLVVTVVLDDAASGSDDAGPIVRRILEGAILNNWVP